MQELLSEGALWLSERRDRNILSADMVSVFEGSPSLLVVLIAIQYRRGKYFPWKMLEEVSVRFLIKLGFIFNIAFTMETGNQLNLSVASKYNNTNNSDSNEHS